MQAYKEAQDVSHNISGAADQLGLDLNGSTTLNLDGGSFPGSPMPAPLEVFVKTLLGDQVTSLFSRCLSLI
jgi:hypothetical protein